MKRYWYNDPEKRPTVNELKRIFWNGILNIGGKKMRKREYQFLVIIFQNPTSSYSAKINEILDYNNYDNGVDNN